MISIPVPELAERPLALTQDAPRVVRGAPGADEDTAPVENRLAVGGPWTCLMTPGALRDDELDADMRRFFAVEAARSDFYLVQVSCTFARDDDEPISRASVLIQLTRDDGPPAPIAWSMQPLRLTSPAPPSLDVKLNAQLKLLGVGVGGEVSRATQEFEPVFIQAAYEGLPNPRWGFSATPTAAIDSVHRLSLVVAAPAGSVVRATATIRATITRRRLGLLNYTAALPDGRPLEFELGA